MQAILWTKNIILTSITNLVISRITMDAPPNPPPHHLDRITEAIHHLRPWLMRLPRQPPDVQHRRHLERLIQVMDQILSHVRRHQLFPNAVRRRIGANQLQHRDRRQFMDLLNIHQHHLRELLDQLRKYIIRIRRFLHQHPGERLARHRQHVEVIYQFTFNI
ncbi:hypothetical protein BT93_B1956 [Corymbia citriodora subsp. variegata]|nr:hypothetical protein BT93_B1956 [Corymbia citriodora subsp. variegata]